jgi:twitching motility protein PilJ
LVVGVVVFVLLAVLAATYGWRQGQAGWQAGAETAQLQPVAENMAQQAQVLHQGQALLRLATEAAKRVEGLGSAWSQQAKQWAEQLPTGATAPDGALAARVGQTVVQTGALAKLAAQQTLLGRHQLLALTESLGHLEVQLKVALEGGSIEGVPVALKPLPDGAARQAAMVLQTAVAAAQNEVKPLLAREAEWTALEAARQNLLRDGDRLSSGVKVALSASSTANAVWMLAPLLPVALAVLCAMGLAYVQIQSERQRQAQSERLRAQALSQEKEAKRINDATQAAILRLMNELQAVAEGDLTQQATVSEDITGAIADSINYTVEELRSLVGQVQGTAQRVAHTTGQVENTSIELLAASTEQLREIRESGQAVLDMAGRITQVSSQAQGSADVARQALNAAESGAKAVQDTIGGMNTIREQIQDTAKRIKRLGESSQEIGEITELISDITEQTNVLALNAAIQAAAAGEAGRGFSVVAEEVQRLAERSGDATRQIAALVRAIQADTQDAVQAMERSTREVVEGARLSDNAGAALADIDALSRQVADLIEQIASSAAREAELAGQTAANIQHIFAVTEQTGEGTRSTVQQVRELARMADELRQSVARFTIA